METNKYLMTQGSYRAKILRFAFPVFLGNLFQQLYNAADSLIVGNYVGHEALAAVSSSGNLIMLLIGFFFGLSMGAGVLTARYIGAQDPQKVHISVHTTLAMGLFCSIVVSLAGVLFAPGILRWMGTPENVLPLSITYFRVYFAGCAGMILYNCCAGILQAAGDSRHPLYYLIFSSLLNICLDLIFIVTFKLSVLGAALGTIISQFCSLFLCLHRLRRVNEAYRVQLSEIRFDWPTLKLIIRIGVPSGVQNCVINFANVLIQSYVNGFGDYAMAGIGAYTKIEGFAFLPINSFSMAMSTYISQNLGARKFDRARQGVRFGVICGCGVSELIGLLFFVTAPLLITAFDSDPMTVAYGVQRARITAPFFCLLAFSHVISAVLRGAGKAQVPMFVMLVCWCGVRVAVLYITSPFFKAIELTHWLYPITWGLSTIAFIIYYVRSNIFDPNRYPAI